mmetsp:Transcript_24308/g.57157  ORF Transcript_24308/g.57157 Transcript_24308/m.57157 type:complete len:251 (+) Transcript_24308:3215-3967(+)
MCNSCTQYKCQQQCRDCSSLHIVDKYVQSHRCRYDSNRPGTGLGMCCSASGTWTLNIPSTRPSHCIWRRNCHSPCRCVLCPQHLRERIHLGRLAHSRHRADAGSCYTLCTRWQTRTCDSSSRRVDKFSLLDRCLTQRSCRDTRTHNFCRVSDTCCPCTRYTQTHLYRCDSESGISHTCCQHLRFLTCSRTRGSPIRTSSRESGSVRFGILCMYGNLRTGCSFRHTSGMFFQTLLHRACKIQVGISPHTFH